GRGCELARPDRVPHPAAAFAHPARQRAAGSAGGKALSLPRARGRGARRLRQHRRRDAAGSGRHEQPPAAAVAADGRAHPDAAGANRRMPQRPPGDAGRCVHAHRPVLPGGAAAGDLPHRTAWAPAPARRGAGQPRRAHRPRRRGGDRRLPAAAGGEPLPAAGGAPGKRPPALPPYRHEALRESFEPLIAALRASLSAVLEQTAIPIPLQERKFGVWVAVVPDLTLLDNAAFVLAAKADVKSEELRRQLPAQSKIGPVEKIRDLVNLQLPGIPVSPMPVAPRQIPYNAGYLYFEFDRHAAMWRELKTSGGIAFHFGSGFAGLDLQLWAIRGG